jgi:hypothetical protein
MMASRRRQEREAFAIVPLRRNRLQKIQQQLGKLVASFFIVRI